MDIKELKNYIYENKYVEQILESIGCHHIRYHSSGYWTCANPDGDNAQAIVIYNNEFLMCTNYTRQIAQNLQRKTDIIDLICYIKNFSFVQTLQYICDEIGISYYYDFYEDVPRSFKIIKMIEEMNSDTVTEEDKPLKPISEHILQYYKPYVNDLFYNDNIDYQTQKDFGIGFDQVTNRYTIPIRSEVGDLVGVKARYFSRDVPENESKYIYLEPCAKSKILYGLNKTINYIRDSGIVFVLEAEKSVMQLWSYGYRSCVSTGGKTMSQHQIDMLVRLGAKIVLCFDQDVQKAEIDEIAGHFTDGVPLYYMFDEGHILDEHESPSDNPKKWYQLVHHNIYKIR